MARLLGPAAERAEHERRLRGAAFYPAMLAVVVATCGVVVWLASRELFAVLPFDGEPPAPWAPVTGGAGLAGLVALALLTAARVGVPGGVGDRLDGASFLAWASALVEAGAALPEAIRGAGSACGAPGRRAAERMAARLEAGGGALVGGSLLAPTEACMLATGAAAGVAGASLAVLAEHRRRRLEHELAAAVMRVELATLALAALAVLAMGVPFYASYSAALR
jgi:type II secretory pathway component PulF